MLGIAVERFSLSFSLSFSLRRIHLSAPHTPGRRICYVMPLIFKCPRPSCPLECHRNLKLGHRIASTAAVADRGILLSPTPPIPLKHNVRIELFSNAEGRSTKNSNS
jgi:hypothetical protein